MIFYLFKKSKYNPRKFLKRNEMKKIVLSLMAACAMFAASNEQVVGFYSQMVG